MWTMMVDVFDVRGAIQALRTPTANDIFRNWASALIQLLRQAGGFRIVELESVKSTMICAGTPSIAA